MPRRNSCMCCPGRATRSGLAAARLDQPTPQLASPVMQGLDCVPLAQVSRRWMFAGACNGAKPRHCHTKKRGNMCAAGSGNAAQALWCTMAPHPHCPHQLSAMVPPPAAGTAVGFLMRRAALGAALKHSIRAGGSGKSLPASLWGGGGGERKAARSGGWSCDT